MKSDFEGLAWLCTRALDRIGRAADRRDRIGLMNGLMHLRGLAWTYLQRHAETLDFVDGVLRDPQDWFDLLDVQARIVDVLRRERLIGKGDPIEGDPDAMAALGLEAMAYE